MIHGNIPGDALPVLNLVSSRDNATIAASICETVVSLTVGPISTISTVLPAPESSSTDLYQKE